MTWKEFQEASTTIIALAGLIPITIGALGYKAKVDAERLNAQKLQAEIDIQLLKHLSELMDIANGRGRAELSSTVIDRLFQQDLVTDFEKANPKALNVKLTEAAIFVMPIGAAAQDTAIAAIYALGKTYLTLAIPAKQALDTLSQFKPIAKLYLEDLITHIAARKNIRWWNRLISYNE